MKVKTRTENRLVLTTNRRLIGLINLASAPIVIWLGLKIVKEGDSEWFGWCFAALGPMMILGGLWAIFIRLSLTLDKDLDLIRYSLHGLTKRRNQMMALSDLNRVEMRTMKIGRHSTDVVDFVAREGTGQKDLRVAEFWTKSAASDAHFEIATWLKGRTP